MDSHKQRRRPRPPSAGPKDWRAKVHPLYLKVLEQYRKVIELSQSPSPDDCQEAERLKRNPPAELMEAVRRYGEERRRSGGTVTPVATTILGSNDPRRALSDMSFMSHWLAWNKYGKSLEQLIAEDRSGSETSSKQVIHVAEAVRKWRYEKLNPERLHTKFDREHWDLIMMGLDFGIEKLTADELADFADAECPCGSHEHSPENLRKLRDRMLAALTGNAGHR